MFKQGIEYKQSTIIRLPFCHKMLKMMTTVCGSGIDKRHTRQPGIIIDCIKS